MRRSVVVAAARAGLGGLGADRKIDHIRRGARPGVEGARAVRRQFPVGRIGQQPVAQRRAQFGQDVEDGVAQGGAVVRRGDGRDAADPAGLAASVQLAVAGVDVAMFQQFDQRPDRGAALAVADHVQRMARVPGRIQRRRIALRIAQRIGRPAFDGLGVALAVDVLRAIVDAAALELGVEFGRPLAVGRDRADDGGEDRVRALVCAQVGGDVALAAPIQEAAARKLVGAEAEEAVHQHDRIVVRGAGGAGQQRQHQAEHGEQDP